MKQRALIPQLVEPPAEAAASWVVLLASGQASTADVIRFRTWISADPLHQRAFDHACKVWKGLAPLEGQARRSVRQPLRRLPVVLAIAAGLASIMLVPRGWHDLSSPTGAVVAGTLADGSRIWLDSGAAVDFHDTPTARTLQLVRGRIHIDIAHDERRPFAVAVENAVIRDVGTSFSVDDLDESFDVAVTDGVVEVHAAQARTRLAAGLSARFSAGRKPELRPLRTADSAWREGRIDLDRTSLAETLRRVERYRRGAIVLLGGAAARPISGSLALHDLEASLDALAAGEQLRLIRLPWLLIVTPE